MRQPLPRHLDGRQLVAQAALLEGPARGLGRRFGRGRPVTELGRLVGEPLFGLVDLGAFGRFQLGDLVLGKLGEEAQEAARAAP